MFKSTICVLLALLGVGAGVRPLLAQSLADVAKKEEDRRKALPTPAKVYTNKDLGAVPPGQPAPIATPAAGSDAAKAADAAKSADAAKGADPGGEKSPNGKDGAGKDGSAKDQAKTTKDQAYWSDRLKDLNLQLSRDQGYADAMQTRLNALNTDFVNRDDPIQRAAIDRDRQKTLAEITRLGKAIVDGKKAVADLLEEARRAGVPPGWLR